MNESTQLQKNKQSIESMVLKDPLSGEVSAIIKAQKDIRKLYSLPMKQVMLPSHNPFFNG